jgi:cell division protein ZapE
MDFGRSSVAGVKVLLPSEFYRERVVSGALEPDLAQERTLERMDALCLSLTHIEDKGSRLFGLLRRKAADAPKGLYLWGSVGRGKTMLMDLMLDAAPVSKKKRVHFQAFMADVHDRIYRFRESVKRGERKDTDPILPVADEIAGDIRLLFLDEFAVTDIADAMILARLFKALFAKGLVLVTTSNVEPDRLYEGGLNRALFLPFIATLKHYVEIVEVDARTDYRLEKLGGSPVYLVPADDKAKREMDAAFRSLLGGAPAKSETLLIKGRTLAVPSAGNGVARFPYEALCKAALGNLDFLAIARTFHTVMIDDIPIINPENRNEAKRFIALIDALYDQSVQLYVSAAAEPSELYRADSGREAFEFDRTASRLIEMQSEDYRALPHGVRAASKV